MNDSESIAPDSTQEWDYTENDIFHHEGQLGIILDLEEYASELDWNRHHPPPGLLWSGRTIPVKDEPDEGPPLNEPPGPFEPHYEVMAFAPLLHLCGEPATIRPGRDWNRLLTVLTG